MRFEELQHRLRAMGHNPSDIVARAVTPESRVDAAYNVIHHDGAYAVATRADRGNDYFLHSHDDADGHSSTSFRSEEDAFDWIWQRANDLHVARLNAPLPWSAEEAEAQLHQQTERVHRRRREHMRQHPELWERYFQEHPDERPT